MDRVPYGDIAEREEEREREMRRRVLKSDATSRD